MSAPLPILVGTMTGTAEMVAGEVRDTLDGMGIAAEMVPLDGKDAGLLKGARLVLFCTSTYGQGDVPDNARDFIASLESAKPDLSGLRYGLIALGDRTYSDTFCEGGRKIDALLARLGAKRVGEALEHDASGPDLPEDAAAAWVRTWAGKAGLG